MTRPLFTVIIPTYNRAELLSGAVRSVLDQSFDDFELLIVDDHSTDHTRHVVTSFKENRIKYILNDHTRGGAGTRNAGISRAQGKWVAFLDDDDQWMPFKLEKLCNKIQEIDHTVGLIYSGFVRYDLRRQKEILTFVPKKEGWIQTELLYENYIHTLSTVSIRTNILKQLGGLDEAFPALQDRELYLRVAGLCQIAYIKEPLVYVNVSHGNRISSNIQYKLKGNLLFLHKYSHLITQNYRLRYIWGSRIFMYATLQPNMLLALKALPWTLLGMFISPSNFIKTILGIGSRWYLWKLAPRIRG